MIDYNNFRQRQYYKRNKEEKRCVKCFKPLEPDLLGNYSVQCPECTSKSRETTLLPKQDTLCWDCIHAVPVTDDRGNNYIYGCEWSIYKKPVPGWEAEKSTVKSQYNKYTSKLLQSYCVKKCPKFKRGRTANRADH